MFNLIILFNAVDSLHSHDRHLLMLFSKFIRPNSVHIGLDVLTSDGANAKIGREADFDAAAFATPNGETIVVLMNRSAQPRKLRLRRPDTNNSAPTAELRVEPSSIVTLVWRSQ